MKKAIVIDTNAYSAFKRGIEAAVEVVTTAELIVLSATVLDELLAGFSNGKQADVNRRELQEFISDPNVIFLSVNAQTAIEYSKIYRQLRTKGTPIPTNDMWIAAIASQLDMAVFSDDAHFSTIEGLRIVQSGEDWNL